MRRQLALVTVAVAALVVVAFVVPLSLLVRQQAEDRALVAAENRTQAAAERLAEVLIDGASDIAAAAAAVVERSGGVDQLTIFAPDGTAFGDATPSSVAVQLAREEAIAFSQRTDDGAEVLVPVTSRDGVFVVRVLVTAEQLRSGVTFAWTVLWLLGAVAIGLAVVAADRLGRSFVEPVNELAETARRIGEGDLDARVSPSGPVEVEGVGVALNDLAGQVDRLLSDERESVADLSHRLRTPLAALKLQVEEIEDTSLAASLEAKVHRIEAAVDELIEDARAGTRRTGPASSDLADVARNRSDYWRVLADKQDRSFSVVASEAPASIPLPEKDVGAIVDALIGNVFAHTPPGTGMHITVEGSTLVVEDEGPGFLRGDPTRRGHSRGGSTGLGLDIVRTAAERTGGSLTTSNTKAGGRVTVRFGQRA